MKAIRHAWKDHVLTALLLFAREKGVDLDRETADQQIIVERPPKPELGDLAIPMFPFAKLLRMAPQAIAEGVAQTLSRQGAGRCEATGPYLNVRLSREQVAAEVLGSVEAAGDGYGRSEALAGRKVMVEFSCPNTNKPLHLGHLRNDALGESVSRILAAAGAQVRKVNLINDRGVHICKSMLAYQKFGAGETPESSERKSDHFVGDFYVRFNQWAKEDKSAETLAREMLQKWEAGDAETVELWKLMNRWAIEGIEETYRRTGVSFDQYYYESETYTAGREEILKGLEAGSFYRDEEGTVWVDLEEINLDRKVLLRSDGTSLYLTQDIGTAIARHRDWPFDQLVYVVASEQRYHFTVLFHLLEKLGFDWARNLYHLSYGMVNLPEGKMKSREGTVVDADDLLVELAGLAEKEIKEKQRDGTVENVEETAEKIALAALHYYLLQVQPNKDMVFNPAESLSFTGNTGPYLQYTGARISTMLRKAGDQPGIEEVDLSLLTEPVEWELIKHIAEFPEILEQAALQLNPAMLASYAYDLARNYSRYYHDNPIMVHQDPAVRRGRLFLSKAVLQVLRNVLELLTIPYIPVM
ncbi:MAG: arginine--tRNA ligase [Alkalispirochaetaceae bacterium]